MTPYEMMLSESQERMLLVAERGREQRSASTCSHKWGLDAVEIGRVTDDGMLRVLHHGQIAAEIPAHALAEEGPVYQRPIAAPPAGRKRAARRIRAARARTSPKISASCLRFADDRVEALDLGAIRFHGAHEYAAKARARATRPWCG